MRLTGPFKNANDYHYQTIRINVNELKVIQLGLTLADDNGNMPEPVSTWQFHFNFNVKYVFFLFFLDFFLKVISF